MENFAGRVSNSNGVNFNKELFEIIENGLNCFKLQRSKF